MEVFQQSREYGSSYLKLATERMMILMLINLKKTRLCFENKTQIYDLHGTTRLFSI
jgi:hypothetical protein